MTLIAQHLPFILLVAITICVFLYVAFRLDEIPQQEKHKHLMNRHPVHSAVGAAIILLIVGLIVISLATEIL